MRYFCKLKLRDFTSAVWICDNHFKWDYFNDFENVSEVILIKDQNGLYYVRIELLEPVTPCLRRELQTAVADMVLHLKEISYMDEKYPPFDY